MILFDKLDYIKEKNNIMDITDIKLHMDMNTIFSEIKNNKSSKYNYIQNNLENLQEAKELLIEGNEEIIIREKIMHEPQTINLLKIYGHLFEPIDYFFLLEQEYQSPLLFRISADVFNNIWNTREAKDIRAPPEILKMIQEIINDSIHSLMNKNIKR